MDLITILADDEFLKREGVDLVGVAVPELVAADPTEIGLSTASGVTTLTVENTIARAQVAIPADKTADYTLVVADANSSIGVSSATAKNVTVPLNASQSFPIGSMVEIRQVGAGQVTIVATGGVTLRSAGGALKTRVQYSAASLLKIASDTWSVQGDIST
jgi:hypothetical protein